MSEISKQALKVDNNTSFPNNNTGYISPSILRAFNVNMIDSLVDEIGYTADSASWNVSIGQLNTYTSSFAPSLTQLNAFTASQLVVNTNLNQFTQSANASISKLDTFSSSFNAYTASINQIRSNGVTLGTATIFNLVGPGTFFSASLVQNIQGNIATLTFSSDSAKVNTSSFNDYTASAQAAFNSYTQSIDAFSASANVSIAALNAYTASDDVSIDLLNAFTASQNVLNATFATTGSNRFNGNQIITGSVTISGSATTDLTVVGQIFVSSSATGATTAPRIAVSGSQGQTTITRNQISTRNLLYQATFAPTLIENSVIATADTIGMAASASGAGIAGWGLGPAIYINDTGDTFPAVFGFQNKANYTDGRVTVLTPLVVNKATTISGSVNITGSLTTVGNMFQVTGSFNTFGNVITQQGVFSSSVDGGLYIDNIGYVGSGSAGGFFIGTTTQDLKIQNWFSSSVDGKNIVIENFSQTGSANIHGKVALRARGTGGAVTVENTSQFRVECNTQITGSVSQNVSASVISLATASIDLNVANYFTLTLSGSTNINVTNPKPGVTATLVINTSTSGSATFSSNVKQPSGSAYVASPSGNIDIISLTSLDSTTVYALPAYSFV